jgi:ParB-like chromosome segregation protein Spo0J
VPAIVLDVDDDEAARLLLIDNASSDAARNDAALLAALLADLDAASSLDGTGYTSDDLAALLARIEPEPIELDDVRPLDRTATHVCPSCGVVFAITADGPSIVS